MRIRELAEELDRLIRDGFADSFVRIDCKVGGVREIRSTFGELTNEDSYYLVEGEPAKMKG